MKSTYGIAIFLLVLVSLAVGIVVTTIPSDTSPVSDMTEHDSQPHDIPVHVYEVWQSNGIIVHGNVEKPTGDDKKPVTILVVDENGMLIEAFQVMPDDSGRFLHGVLKTGHVWEDIKEYDVTASYSHPAVSEDDMLSGIMLEKDKIPLTSDQVSSLSHNQIIKTIKEWNSIGGSSPFVVVSLIGMKDSYDLGDPMPFFVQKSGYGNPCHDQGVVVFNDQKKIRVATAFYLEMCDSETSLLEPFDYLVPYNFDIFPKLAPLTEPGTYTMVAGADKSEKQKHTFTILESGYTYDYKIIYRMQKGSHGNTQTMTIDLNSNSILVENADGTTRELSVDSDTVNRIDSEIRDNNLITNPMTNHSYGESCDTCNFGMMQVYVGDVLVHYLLFDDAALLEGTHLNEGIFGDSPYFFSLVDCVASQNGFDTYWISDSDVINKDSHDGECSEIGINDARALPDRYGQDDYDNWVNDKPRRNVPEGAGSLGSTHAHASILVKIFGDKFDFSDSAYQIKNPYIHFEGKDGNTIHMHATGVPLGFLFETMSIGITDECFVFPDKREFCTNEEYSLKFYINEEQVDSVADHVIAQNERILISYGPEDEKQTKDEIEDLNSQMIIG